MSAKKKVSVEDAQAEVDRLRVMVFGWSYTPREVIEKLTKAIGMCIDGFEFEHRESYYGKPGRITVNGITPDDGKEWHVELAITRIDEIDTSSDCNDEDDE